MKMTLSDALRWQKRVVAIIQKIEQAVRQSNCVQEGQVREFDVRKLITLRETWVNHLVDLKLRKMDATRPIQELIFRLAELKTAIQFFQQMPVTHGVQVDRYAMRAGVEAKPIKFIAEVRARERDKYVKSLQTEIDAAQKAIDAFNFSNSFEIEVPQEDEYSAAVEVPEGAEVAATEDD